MPNSKGIRKVPIVLTIGIFLSAGVFYSSKWLQQLTFVPIEVVTLTEKLHYADPQAIKEAVRPYLNAGFFGLEVGKIRNELRGVPWIADANVQREWPGTVRIKIFERQPLATWQGKGIIDTEGKLFFPTTLANVNGLPEFVGQQNAVDAMVDTYLLMMATLKPIGLAVKKLELMPDHGWRAMLDNEINIIVGHKEIEERLKRFVWAYNSLQNGSQGEQKIRVVDLRYTNGLSVG
jgi:cell division protein FtsQ